MSPWSKAQRLPKQKLRILYDDGASAWEVFPAAGIKLLEPKKKEKGVGGAGGSKTPAAAAATTSTMASSSAAAAGDVEAAAKAAKTSAAAKEDRWLEAIFLAEHGSRDAFVFKVRRCVGAVGCVGRVLGFGGLRCVL